ncbi:MAG TPA: M14 family zinc carboxypeptidase [Nocardioidaceae bacterium]|nr:M14 family zinc carboxypeptidase [Nocardioidaceae bacterium]
MTAANRMRRRLTGGARSAVVSLALLAGVVVVATPMSSQAQDPGEVTGLEVVQADGYATLSWTPVAGATDYQIERTPVDAQNTPTGPSVITGVWLPNRTVTPDAPSFADAGFAPGDRFQWRVRASIDSTPQPFSEPVFATTEAQFGDPSKPGEGLRTEWELTQAAQFTSDVNEYAYEAQLAAASDRVRLVEIGRTIQNRPINMFVIGHPTPRPTAKSISGSPTALVNCNVHGNEPSSREACLILARELAFADDRRTIDLLRQTTILLVPAINGDGRAANTRGNATGQDLNRDHSLLREPETFAFAEMLRDYTPDAAFDGHEFGNSQAGDLPTLPPRHQNVAQSIFDESQNLITGWLYSHGSSDGWWFCPYGCQNGGNVGLSEETILRNVMGMKSVVGSLLEARSAGGATRPDEANPQNNRRRKTYSAIYTYQQFFDYFHANYPAIKRAINESIAFQTSNTGRIVFRGSRPIPAFPPPHPGESPPPIDAPGPDQILAEPPCGYFLTHEQYTTVLADDPGVPVELRTSVAERLAAHGIAAHRVRTDDLGAGYFVAMAQPLRGLIPLLLDGQAAEPMVEAVRLLPATGSDGETECTSGEAVPTATLHAGYDLDYSGH